MSRTKEMLRELKIRVLKTRLAEKVKVIYAKRDALSCGKVLAKQVSPTIAKLEAEADSILDDLTKIDPSTPAGRFHKGDW